MMKKYGAGFLSLFLVLSLAGLIGCGHKNGVEIKLASWGDVQETQILTDLIAEFEQIHPDIHVQLQRVSYPEYVTKLLTQMVGGLAPDVICVEVGNFEDFYLRDALQPLNDYLKTGSTDLKNYYSEEVDRFTVDGQVYVIPRDTAPICLVYYNQSAFDEAGVPYPKDDWDTVDFVRAAQKVMKTDATGRVTRWGFVDDWTMSESWVYDFGGSYADNVKHPTRWTFAEDANSLAGVQFRSDLINQYKVMLPPASIAAMGGMGNSDMFMNGSTAMFLSGIWKTPAFREIKKFKWNVVLLPKGPHGHRGFSTGGSGYGILKTSAHPQEAWQLIQFISGEEGAKKFAATGFAQPALKKISDSPAFLDDQEPTNKKMLIGAVKYAQYGPICKNWTEVVSGLIGPELEKVWSGNETPEQAMARLKPLLAKNPPDTK